MRGTTNAQTGVAKAKPFTLQWDGVWERSSTDSYWYDIHYFDAQASAILDEVQSIVAEGRLISSRLTNHISDGSTAYGEKQYAQLITGLSSSGGIVVSLRDRYTNANLQGPLTFTRQSSGIWKYTNVRTSSRTSTAGDRTTGYIQGIIFYIA